MTVVRRSSARSGVVFGGAAEDLLRHRVCTGVCVDVDLRRCQRRVFVANGPQQSAQPGLIEVDLVAGGDGLRPAGDDIQPRRLRLGVGQLTGDLHDLRDEFTTAGQALLGGRPARRGRHEHQPGQLTGVEVIDPNAGAAVDGSAP